MNILFVTNYFPPEIGAASHLYYYLGKELVKREHKVFVLTGTPRYNISYEEYIQYRKNNPAIENIEGIEVLRCNLPYVPRKKKIRRGIEHLEIALKLFNCGKKYLKNMALNIDVSLVYSPPITLYYPAKKLGKLYNFPYIFNVQDLFPKEAIDTGMLKNPILIKIFREIEYRAYTHATFITVHSERNGDYVKNLINEKGKIVIIENWVNSEEIKPGNKQNPFSKKHGLEDKFVVSFAGTLGFVQNTRVIVEAAELTQEFKNIHYLIVGGGPRFEETKRMIEEKQLKNITLLPMVPREEYPLVLHTSDISLVTLISDLKTPVVPSKILSIMSAGIPVVASLNPDGDAPKLIEKAKAGICLPPEAPKALADAILKLYKDKSLREEMGKNGRKYVEKHLSVEVAANKYEELFEKAIEIYKGRSKYA